MNTKQNEIITLLLSNACNKDMTISNRSACIKSCASKILITSKEESVLKVCLNIIERTDDKSVVNALNRMEEIFIFSTDTEIDND